MWPPFLSRVSRQQRRERAHVANQISLVGTEDARVIEAGRRAPAVRDHAAATDIQVRARTTDARYRPLLPGIAIKLLAREKFGKTVVKDRPWALEPICLGMGDLERIILV